jgi:hypothetical protein
MTKKTDEKTSEFQVRLHLKGTMAKRFGEMKDYYNFEHNADLMRMLIAQAYEEFKKKNVSDFTK